MCQRLTLEQFGFVLALFSHSRLPPFGFTSHYAFAPRPTPHASRPTTPGPAGSGPCVDLPPLATACHRPPNCQKSNGPDLDERSFYFSMPPNQAIVTDKIICASPLAAAQ